MLVKWSKAMNEPIDPDLLEEVTRYEQIQKEIIESVKQNSINDLVEASKVAEDFVRKVNIEYPKPPTLDEVMQVLKEEQNELVQAQATQVSPEPQSLAKRAAEHITKEALLEKDSFQQPNPPLVDKNLEAVQKKLKFLEQAIGKIAAHGPGSGETRFMNLDDVDRASFANRDTHKVLRYKPDPTNPAFDSVYFDFLSGDQGPIYSMKYDVTGYTANANVAPGLTYYDPERDTLEILHKDRAATYVGLDNYIRVTNNGSGNIIPRGSFVQFVGVDATNQVPIVAPFTADANVVPLYAVGLTATELQSNTLGRAILLGEIEDINTTGNTVNESWQIGDILWAHPSIAGALTKVKPTAPNVAMSVAAVLSVDDTEGHLLVRPTIWPRLRYGDFYSTLPQVAPSPNVDVKLAISNTLISSGFTISGNSIVALDSGLYKFQTRAQITSTSSSSKSVILWYKKNGVNVPRSSVRQSIAENGGYRTITNFQLISLDAGDNVSVHFTVTDTTIFVDAPPAFNGAPEIPSIQIAVTEAAL